MHAAREPGSSVPDAVSARMLQFADVTIDLDRFRVKRSGVAVHVGPIEYRLLCHFLKHPDAVLSRADLVHAAWPEGTRIRLSTIDMHILRLRRALATAGEGEFIYTVRAVGYALHAPAPNVPS